MPSGGRAAPRSPELAANERLREYVQDRLAGVVRGPDGRPVPGPAARFIGRRTSATIRTARSRNSGG
jgi:hypothetical protein